MMGTLQGIASITASYVHENGEHKTWDVGHTCKVTLDGQECTLGDLRRGDHVVFSGQPAATIIATRRNFNTTDADRRGEFGQAGTFGQAGAFSGGNRSDAEWESLRRELADHDAGGTRNSGAVSGDQPGAAVSNPTKQGDRPAGPAPLKK